MKSALRYIVQNAGACGVDFLRKILLRTMQEMHHDAKEELRLRDYIDDTEESTLVEYRAIGAKTFTDKKLACLSCRRPA